jgi:hypothetical protein
MQSGSLNLLEPSGPRDCFNFALVSYYIDLKKKKSGFSVYVYFFGRFRLGRSMTLINFTSFSRGRQLASFRTKVRWDLAQGELMEGKSIVNF